MLGADPLIKAHAVPSAGCALVRQGMDTSRYCWPDYHASLLVGKYSGSYSDISVDNAVGCTGLKTGAGHCLLRFGAWHNGDFCDEEEYCVVGRGPRGMVATLRNRGSSPLQCMELASRQLTTPRSQVPGRWLHI